MNDPQTTPDSNNSAVQANTPTEGQEQALRRSARKRRAPGPWWKTYSRSNLCPLVLASTFSPLGSSPTTSVPVSSPHSSFPTVEQPLGSSIQTEDAPHKNPLSVPTSSPVITHHENEQSPGEISQAAEVPHNNPLSTPASSPPPSCSKSQQPLGKIIQATRALHKEASLSQTACAGKKPWDESRGSEAHNKEARTNALRCGGNSSSIKTPSRIAPIQATQISDANAQVTVRYEAQTPCYLRTSAHKQCREARESGLVTPTLNRYPFRPIDSNVSVPSASPPGAPRKLKITYRTSRGGFQLEPIPHNPTPSVEKPLFDIVGLQANTSTGATDQVIDNMKEEINDKPILTDPAKIQTHKTLTGIEIANDANDEQSARTHMPFIVAKQKDIRFSFVPIDSGVIKISVCLSMDSGFAGELRIPALSSTGIRRTLKGDEFYFVRSGLLRWDVDKTRIFVSEGDFFAVSPNTSFEIRNTSFHEAAVVFFSPTQD